MSKRTIAKFSAFVIFLAALGVLFSSCGSSSKSERAVDNNLHFGPPTVLGTIRSKDITESSGLAVSGCQSDVLWTHNDSGDGPFIFAIDTTGKVLGTYEVQNAKNVDWEDIAAFKDQAGKCFIYIGEIGDNDSKRTEHAVYRVPEPKVIAGGEPSNRKHPLLTESAEILRFHYPDINQNAETLMVQPRNGDIYVLTKRQTGPSGVYRIKPNFGGDGDQTAEKVGEVSVPAIPNGLLTGGDISPDGRHVILCDYTQGYELTLPDGAVNFDDIWKQKPEPVPLGKREHGEAIAYNADGSAIFATSEHDNSPLIEVRRKQ